MNSGTINSLSPDPALLFRTEVAVQELHPMRDLGTFTEFSSSPSGIRLISYEIGPDDVVGKTSTTNGLHAENLSPKTPLRNSRHVAFSNRPTISEAGVMMQKPYASSPFEPYSSAISTHAGIPYIADGPSGLVVLGLALLSLAFVVFLKCKSSSRGRTVQL